MAFSQEVINLAWNRANGRCECTLIKCRHTGKCNKELDPRNEIQGKKWEAHHKVSQDVNGSDGLGNCQILCIECHKNTGSFGG